MFSLGTRIFTPSRILGFEGGEPSPLHYASRMQRIRAGVLVIYGLIVAFVLAVTVWSSIAERRDRIADAKAQAATLVRALDQHFARILDGAAQYLISLRSAIEGAGGIDAMTEKQLEQAMRVRRIRDEAERPRAYVIDSEARKRAAVPDKPGANNAANRDFFGYHRDYADRDIRVSVPFKARSDGKLAMPISLRLQRRDGTFDGIAMTALRFDGLVDFYRSLQLEHDGAVLLARSDGTFLLRFPTPEQSAPPRLPPQIVEKIAAPNGVFEARSPFDGMERIGAFEGVDGYPVTVIVTYSKERLLEGWWRNTALRVLGAILGIAALTVLTALLLRRLAHEREAVSQLQNFRRAVDRSADLVYWVDKDARIIYTNEMAARRLGYDNGRIPVGVSLHEFYASLTPEPWAEFWKRIRQSGSARFEAIQATRWGDTYPAGIAASYMELDGRGYAFINARDLTEEKSRELEIRELNATLEERVRDRTEELAATNAELESFGYSVSHDLRSPLRHMTAYAEMLKRIDGGRTEEETRLVDKILERSGYMNRLIDSLLGLARITRAEISRQHVDVSGIAHRLIEQLRHAEPVREVVVNVAPGLVAHADATLVTTLLQNLIANAWKYSSRKDRASIEVGSLLQEGKPVFFVRDNGAGFDPEYANKLFGAFQRLHSANEFPGTGVGLAIARRIVTRHHGRIWADSTPGQGATFFFTLPEGTFEAA